MDVDTAQKIVTKAARYAGVAKHLTEWQVISEGGDYVNAKLVRREDGKVVSGIVFIQDYVPADTMPPIRAIMREMADDLTIAMQPVFERHRQRLLEESSRILAELQSPGTVTVKAEGNVKVNVE